MIIIAFKSTWCIEQSIKTKLFRYLCEFSNNHWLILFEMLNLLLKVAGCYFFTLDKKCKKGFKKLPKDKSLDGFSVRKGVCSSDDSEGPPK